MLSHIHVKTFKFQVADNLLPISGVTVWEEPIHRPNVKLSIGRRVLDGFPIVLVHVGYVAVRFEFVSPQLRELVFGGIGRYANLIFWNIRYDSIDKICLFASCGQARVFEYASQLCNLLRAKRMGFWHPFQEAVGREVF